MTQSCGEVARTVFAASALVAALACGGGSSSTSGSASISGTIRGQSMSAKDATAANLSFNATGRGGSAAVIGITSAAGICPQLTSGKEPKSTQYLVLSAFRLQPDGSAAPPPSAGVYPVGALTIENAVAVFAATDAACHDTVASDSVATSGNVTFTSVGSRYAGTFDLTFGFGDHVTGTFDAPMCPGLAEFAEGKGTLACQ
jgi:hypothetical protein